MMQHATTPNFVPCPQCAGKRVIESTVTNWRRYGGVDYIDPRQPTRIRVDVCPSCNYAGVVDAADLDAIFRRTAAAQLLISDRAGEAL